MQPHNWLAVEVCKDALHKLIFHDLVKMEFSICVTYKIYEFSVKTFWICVLFFFHSGIVYCSVWRVKQYLNVKSLNSISNIIHSLIDTNNRTVPVTGNFSSIKAHRQSERPLPTVKDKHANATPLDVVWIFNRTSGEFHFRSWKLVTFTIWWNHGVI